MSQAQQETITDQLAEALRGSIGALEFSRDYHKDLGNKEQAFCQDKLDAAVKAVEAYDQIKQATP
jgi:hypothetical protein